MCVVVSCEEVLVPVVFPAATAGGLVSVALAVGDVGGTVEVSSFVEEPVGADMLICPVGDLFWFALVHVNQLVLIAP